MSARSMIRRHQREVQRGLSRKTFTGVAAVAGAAAIAAPGASAATFPVTNTDDAGAGSLRAAIAAANAAPDADTITFTGVSGQIKLTTGELDVETALTIQGPGPGALSISGEDASPILDVDTSVGGADRDPVTVSGLTLTKGAGTEGGAINSNLSTLSLNDIVFSDNEATSSGGAIYTFRSPLSITDSKVTGNTAGQGGGAIYTDGANALNEDQDSVTIRNTAIYGNQSGSNGGVLYVDNATGGDVLIANSELRDNTSGGSGGALFFYGSKGLMTVRGSTISGNDATSDGGGIYFNSDYYDDGLVVENSTVAGNTAALEGGGINIYNRNDEPVTIRNSTIAGNSSGGAGAGIFRYDAPVDVSSTIVADNDTPSGDQDDLGQEPTATGSFNVGSSLLENVPNTVTVATTGPNKIGIDPQLGPLGANGGTTPTQVPALTSPAIDAGVANSLATDQRGLNRTVEEPTVPNSAGSDGTDIGAVELQLPAPPPDTTVEGVKLEVVKKQKQKGKKVVVKVTAGATEAVSLDATGKVKAGKKNYGLKPTKTNAGAGKKVTLKLKPSGKKGTKAIAKFLAAGKKAKANVKVAFTDAAGNKASESAKVTLTGSKPKKK